jgi:hypothetical protein
MPNGVITRTEDPNYIQTRPDWAVGCPYRTFPLPPLPILPPLKRIRLKSKPVKIEVPATPSTVTKE